MPYPKIVEILIKLEKCEKQNKCITEKYKMHQKQINDEIVKLFENFSKTKINKELEKKLKSTENKQEKTQIMQEYNKHKDVKEYKAKLKELQDKLKKSKEKLEYQKCMFDNCANILREVLKVKKENATKECNKKNKNACSKLKKLEKINIDNLTFQQYKKLKIIG